MRTAQQTRAQRRAQDRNATVRAVIGYQHHKINRWIEQDQLKTASIVEKIASVRSLKYDEQAKAHLTVIEGKHGPTVVIHGSSAAAAIVDAAIWNEYTSLEERPQTHIIPRIGLTDRLYLRLFKPVMEFEDIQYKVLDQASRDTLAAIWHKVKQAHPDNRAAFQAALMQGFTPVFIEGTNPRLKWKSDETLLSRSKPDSLDKVKVRRETSRTGERVFEQETDDLPTWDDKTPRTWDDEHRQPQTPTV